MAENTGKNKGKKGSACGQKKAAADADFQQQNTETLHTGETCPAEDHPEAPEESGINAASSTADQEGAQELNEEATAATEEKELQNQISELNKNMCRLNEEKQELEQKLLDRCRELDLEYGYIVESMPNVTDELPNITRLYVKDGRKEQVYGAKLQNFTSRSLRDILAAGDDETIFNLPEGADPARSFIVPSLLVDEVELVPTGKHPDRKPFVSRPK